MKKILYAILFFMVSQVRAVMQVPAVEHCGGKCPPGQHCVLDEASNSVIPTYKCEVILTK